jgi:polar amino acid transport system substrate-binding protein
LAAWWVWPLPASAGVRPEVPAFATSALLAKIRARGEVAIGVRDDFPPFGMVDAKGRLRGLELDLAQALADHLGVDLRPVPVTPDNRFERLRQGAVDILIASAGDTLARRMGVTAVEPHYYGSGVNVLLRPERTERDWSQLRGSTLCAVEGAAFNAWLMHRHHVSLHLQPSVADALGALAQGRCAGLLYTGAAVQHLRRLADWRHYRLPMDSALVVPWAISLPHAEQGTELEREVGNALARWHREGTLIALEKKWELKPSRFLQEARARWSARRADGTLVCARDARGHWPSDCLDATFVQPQQAEGVLRLAVWLRDRWGVRLAPAGEAYDGARYLRSLGLTGLLAGAVLAGAWMLLSWATRWLLAAGSVVTAWGDQVASGVQATRAARSKARLSPAREAPRAPPMWALLAAP